MSSRRRRAVGVIGFALVVLSFVVLWHGMWASAGLDAFASQWGARLQGGVLNEASFRELHPGVPLPDQRVLLDDLNNFAGRRLVWTTLLAPTATLVSGVCLLAIALIPSRMPAAGRPV